MDPLAFFRMTKLFQESGETRLKAMIYDNKVEVVRANGAARVTSLVRRYATFVEEIPH